MITKIYTGETEHVLHRAFYNSLPKIKQQFQLFALVISNESCTIEFAYCEADADPTGDNWSQWCYFIKENYLEISAIKLINANGEIIFDGVIDPEADIEFTHDSSIIRFEFLGVLSQKLDETLPDNIGAFSGFVPTYEEWLANPDAPVGTNIVRFLIEYFFQTYLPDVTLHLPASSLQLPVEYIYGNLASNINSEHLTVISFSIDLDLGGRTYLDVLKTFSAITLTKIYFIGNHAYFKSILEDSEPVLPDGKLLEISQKKISKPLEYGGVSGIYLVLLIYRNFNNTVTEQEYDAEAINQYLETYYNEIGNISVIERTIEGINSNLSAGITMVFNLKNMIIRELEIDTAFIDEEYQPILIKAIDMVG